MPCRPRVVALPRLPSTYIRHKKCTIRPTVHQFVGRLYPPARSPSPHRRPGLGAPLFLMALNPRASCATCRNRPPYTNLALTSTNREQTSTPPLSTAPLHPLFRSGFSASGYTASNLRAQWGTRALSLEGQRRPHQLALAVAPVSFPFSSHWLSLSPGLLWEQLLLLAGQTGQSRRESQPARLPLHISPPPKTPMLCSAKPCLDWPVVAHSLRFSLADILVAKSQPVPLAHGA
jgi:hypothetical protein